MSRSEKRYAFSAVMGALALGVSACGSSEQDARIRVRFPEFSESVESQPPGSLRSALAVGMTQPGCPAQMRLSAESRETTDVPESRLSGVKMHWLRFFDSILAFDHSRAPLFFSDSPTEELTGQELEVTAGRAWTVKADGGATLKCKGGDIGACGGYFGSAAAMLDGQSPFSISAKPAAPTFTDSAWECPSSGTLFWNGATVTLDHTTSTDYQMLVVPFKGESSSSVTPVAGESKDVDLNVIAARVPFGAYSFGAMVGTGSAQPLGNFDGDTSNASSGATIKDQYLAPFYDLELINLSSRIKFDPAPTNVRLIPLLRGTSLWRGISDGDVTDFLTDLVNPSSLSAHLYPIPFDELEWVGFILDCQDPAPAATSPNCGNVTIQDATGASLGPTLWPKNSLLCLIKEDINLGDPEGGGISRSDASAPFKLQGDLSHSSWKWYSRSFSTVTSLAPPTCLDFMGQ